LLIQKYGFAPERLGASGYAEYRPAATNVTPEGRAMKRRVDIVIPRKRN
jgi:chemotaxis protein MotB